MIDVRTLLHAYCSGIFPMADDRLSTAVHWIDPLYRCVMPLDDRFHTARSLRRLIRKDIYQITANSAFHHVVHNCARVGKHRQTTWISLELQQATEYLFDLGYAHSVEIWTDKKLIGGLYGIALGSLFIGESMFSLIPDTSKMALVTLVKHLRQQNFSLFDCQFPTTHLSRFGAFEIHRETYLKLLQNALKQNCRFSDDAAVSLHELDARLGEQPRPPRRPFPLAPGE